MTPALGHSSVTIPAGVTSIGKYAFAECDSLATVSLPDGVTGIGNYVFQNCVALTTITIPDGVTSIGKGAFEFCRSLTSLVFPDSVTSIGDNVFYKCTSLTSVTIPDSVTSIGNYAFRDCSRLDWIGFQGNAPTFAAKVFYNANTTAYYPAHNTTWTDAKRQNYGGTVTWEAYKTQAQITDQDGTILTNGTIWIDLNANVPSFTFCASTAPVMAGDDCRWFWSDGPGSVTENADGTLTVTAAGTPGTMTLTATAQDGSNAAAVTIKFVSLAPEREEVPGDTEDPADMTLLSGKNRSLKLYDADTGKALTAKQVTWSMDPAYAPYATITACRQAYRQEGGGEGAGGGRGLHRGQ